MTLHSNPSKPGQKAPVYGWPEQQGLYDPAAEHESCGVGFVAHIKGEPSHQIVVDADIILKNMDHRGACGCEPNTGDGAGMMTGLPYEFMKQVAKADLGVDLPEPGKFASGLVFLPQDEKERAICKAQMENEIKEQGQKLVGWREVPVDPDGADIGPSARACEPKIEMLFVEAGIDAEGNQLSGDDFERKLYLIRKFVSNQLRQREDLAQAKIFYVPSLSTKVIIYKGMLTPAQVLPYFDDLRNPAYTSHLAMVHSRFSTNTFPSWDRAQPCRFMSHNGEINTMRGNINWMHAREGVVKSEYFKDDIDRLFPIMEPDCSDSGSFDNALEFLLMNGRTLQEGVLMMIPEAWQNHETMSPSKRAFYEYHSCLMEPWDGPASVVFTDGHYIGAVLDRNGLRPSRYYLTKDDRVIMASEVGVLPDIEPTNVVEKGRLQPGKIFLIDFEEGRMVPDEEVKEMAAKARPYAKWLSEQRIELKDLHPEAEGHGFEPDTLLARMKAFGYTQETMQFMLLPLIAQKRDPVGSMGNDAALAVLSDKPRMLYDYFKQLFAQVTNPAIDSIREEIIMSLECYIGPEGNLLEVGEQHAHRLRVPHPILTNEEIAAIKHIEDAPRGMGWKAQCIDITWDRSEGQDGLVKALDRICQEAETAVDEGYSLVVLSDRGVGENRVPVSALLATGAVHHHLVRTTKRTRIGIVLETGEAREVHHFCMLTGFGADVINPYLAFEALWDARKQGLLSKQFPVDPSKAETVEEAIAADQKVVSIYRKSVAKGMLKVFAKMGISTLQSYKGAQIFEAIGLQREVMDKCFNGTASRIEGAGFDVLAEELLRRHERGYPQRSEVKLDVLPNPGDFHWRSGGEHHGWSPEVISQLQVASRKNDETAYWMFANAANEDSKQKGTLRGLLKFKDGGDLPTSGPISIDEVEPAANIVRRFATGAMSFGSISAEAHESLAIAMNRLGGKSNTGEGGEEPERFTPLPNGDSKRSSIKQIASGRFGVNIEYLTNADELQIKVSQGAKPGEGGELPGKKVDERIARVRFSTPGVGLISPPPHHDIYSIEDLAQLIHDLKNANPSARISVKLVSEVGVGTVATGVSKAHADHIMISGHDGGTGASPLTSIKHAGMPWEIGIAEAHQTLVLNDLRSRVAVQIDGMLRTGRDVVIATLLGAEEYGFSTAPLITLGCIMMRKCHLNTCPVGVATQDPVLRNKFSGKPDYVVNYLFMVAEEARQIMAQLGFRTIDEMVGRADCLETDEAASHWKSKGLDLTNILKMAEKPHDGVGVYCSQAQDHGLEKALDNTQLIRLCEPAIERREAVTAELPIYNINRTVGTILSHELTKRYGADGLSEDTIKLKFNGSAGQSFGAFLTRGVRMTVEGDANDYVGKGLSGGKVIIYPPKEASFVPEDNIIVGNVCLYGATKGGAYIRGRAAERFCVRNSGAYAVVEGVGDHGCEYMTGGRMVCLGPTGRNFAAGMSGGVAYVWDKQKDFITKVNLGMVELEKVENEEDVSELLDLIQLHFRYTKSTVAQKILDNWPHCLSEFVKVMPTDYKRVLMERKQHDEEVEAAVHTPEASH